MRHIASPRIAAVSALLVLGVVQAARRPHYGGELHLEMRAALRNLDPTDREDDSLTLASKDQLIPFVFETLVRFDEHGDAQPWLATSWAHDSARKRWVFTPRTGVTLHNGANWSSQGGVIEIPDDKPIDQILRELARPQNAAVVRGEDGSLNGTGPFRVARWDVEKGATLVAHNAYWGGRPFLDSIELRMGRGFRDQETDLEIGKADVIEIPATEARRFRQKGASIFATPPMETLALLVDNPRIADATREALALSIDRTAIYNVLLQKQGEISGGILPRWLSGYAFLFSTERNIVRARQLAANSPASTFAFDRQDGIARPIGERIAVNANEAGITLRPVAGNADVRLTMLPVTSRDAWTALEDMASMLKLSLPASSSLYEAERTMLEGYRVIPLVQLPKTWAMSSRVKEWPRLADVWLDSK